MFIRALDPCIRVFVPLTCPWGRSARRRHDRPLVCLCSDDIDDLPFHQGNLKATTPLALPMHNNRPD